ncbi:MAG: D-alanyl-D-alanine carboxypeptidase family protein [Actinomycetota bacterium]
MSSLKFLLGKISIFILSVFLIFTIAPSLYAGDSPEITAESALVMEYESGKILWEKNSSRRVFPASTTKMLSAITAIENITDLDEMVEISGNAAGRNHSFFRFYEGDKVSVMDLLKAALICSHNNATVALAEHVSGSEEEFVKLMNEKAKELGAINTYFQNTNGLDTAYALHRSTAKDLAIIARYSMENPIFREIVNTFQDTIEINGEEIEIGNTNPLLQLNYIKGIKTGYTAKAGYCIVIYSDTENLDLITVILNSTSESRENDAIMLTDYVNRNYSYKLLVEKDTLSDTISVGELNRVDIELYPESDYIDLVNVREDIIEVEYQVHGDAMLPIEENQKLGSLSVYVNDSKAAELPLISRESVSMPQVEQHLSSHREEQDRKILFFLFGFYFFIFISIMIKNLFFRKKFYV